MLEESGIEAVAPLETPRGTFVAPFVNAEKAQYLVVEDKFPNGRPALEKAGVQSYTQSTRTSSVSYSRTFANIGLTLAATMNLSQNVRDSSISMTLPSLNISLARFNPFKRKKMVGAERWYEKIAVSYTGTFSNSISTKEDKLLHSNLIKDWKNGMKHQIPVSASFTLFNYINVTPSFNFQDRMYTYKVRRSWDESHQTELRDTTYGFYNVYDYSMSLSASTKLYGFYRPLIGHKIQTIRHVFTPTLSFSYSPDFSASRFGYYDTYAPRSASPPSVRTTTAGPSPRVPRR